MLNKINKKLRKINFIPNKITQPTIITKSQMIRFWKWCLRSFEIFTMAAKLGWLIDTKQLNINSMHVCSNISFISFFFISTLYFSYAILCFIIALYILFPYMCLLSLEKCRCCNFHIHKHTSYIFCSPCHWVSLSLTQMSILAWPSHTYVSVY